MSIIRWIYRRWCHLIGKPVPIWALPKVGRIGVIDGL
jgi:hypothetical protein